MMRTTYLPFALPDIDDAELNEIQDALASGWITTGPKVRQFEAEFAAYVGAKHAVAVNSCTAAMHLALEAIGLKRGDIVLTTPYTFAATAEVVRYFDATPVFVDIEPDTLNISPKGIREKVEKLKREKGAAIHGRIKAVIPVHIAGHPCDMEAIVQIAEEYGLAIIEDAAHALPAYYKGHMIGAAWKVEDGRRKTEDGKWETENGGSGVRPPTSDFRPPTSDLQLPTSDLQPPTSEFLHAVAFSFYATKTMTTGEGGMLTTDNDEIADRVRVMALHGISKDAWKRYTAEGSWYYEIIAPGYKYNMTDIAAAMGLAQLRKIEKMWKRRKEIARRYTEAFSQFPELEPPTVRPDVQHAWHLYILRLNLDRLRISRNQFIEELKARNIGTSVHFIPLHLHPYYRETYGYKPNDFPVAYREYQRVISLPIYSRMSDRDVEDVVEAVIDVVKKYKR